MTPRIRLASFAVSLLLIAASHTPAAEPVWTPFESAAAGFKIEFPSKDVKTVKEPGFSAFMSPLPGTEAHFRVDVSPASSTPEGEKATREALVKIRDIASTNLKATVSNPKEIIVSGFAGIQFDQELDSKGAKYQIVSRYLYANGQFYQLIVVRAKGNDYTKEIEKFFDTFAILAK